MRFNDKEIPIGSLSNVAQLLNFRKNFKLY